MKRALGLATEKNARNRESVSSAIELIEFYLLIRDKKNCLGEMGANSVEEITTTDPQPAVAAASPQTNTHTPGRSVGRPASRMTTDGGRKTTVTAATTTQHHVATQGNEDDIKYCRLIALEGGTA